MTVIMLTVKRAVRHNRRMPRRTSEADPSAVTLAVAGFLDACRTANTRAAYRSDLGHLAAWCGENRPLDLLTIDADDVARYRTACELSGASAATVARRLSTIASFGAFAEQTGAESALGSSQIARPVVAAESSAALISDDDAARLLASADRIGTRSAAVIRLLMLDGLKVSELGGADAVDVRGRPPRVTLELHKPRPRIIDLHPQTGAALRKYLGRRRDGPLLLSEQRGRPPTRLTRFGIDYLVKQAARAAGITQPVSSNALRRRFVMVAHADGADLDEIRRRSGHAQSRTTRRYLNRKQSGPPHDPATVT